MRVAVIGAGAMGSIMAFLLHRGGMEVVLYERREERLADIRRNGVRLKGEIGGQEFLDIKQAGEPDAPFDLMIIAVPAGKGADALRQHSPFVHRDTLYLSLQEGSAAGELAQLVGGDRAGAVEPWVSAEETPAGEVEVEGFRSLVLVGCGSPQEAGFLPLVEAVDSPCPGRARLAGDLHEETWRRLEAAAGVSALCGVLGAPPGEIRDRDEVDVICRDAAEECRQAAASAGQEATPPVAPWEEAVWDRLKPPMLLDIEAARATEVDYLCGYVVEHARSAGKPVPVQVAMHSMIKEMESGRRLPGENSLKELRRRIEEEKGMALL